MIRKVGGRWCLFTKDGSKKIACHDTKAEAEAQEAAIEIQKHKKEARSADGHPILFRDGKWCILSLDRTWVLSRHDTLASAREWKKARGLARHVHLMAATGTIRTAMFESREHVVVPVVALVEGVIWPVNANTPELVLAEEFSKAPQGWDGRPVLPDHPAAGDSRISANEPFILEKQAFGRVFHTKAAGKRLLMEAWLDPARAEKVGAAKQLERIRNGEMVEISVGAYVVPEEKTGNYNGQPYKTIWREIVPDHLAILPEGVVGACSIEMGCGTPRAAIVHLVAHEQLKPIMAKEAKMEEEEVEPPERDWRQGFAAQYRGATEDLSDVDIRGLIDTALRELEPGYLGVDSVFPDESTVVYAVAPKEVVQMFRRGFEVNDGKVKLSNDKEEVKPVTRFEPVAASAAPCGCGDAKHNEAAGGEPMTKKELVQKILARKDKRFCMKDATVLEQLSEDRLKALAEEPEQEPEPKPKEPEPKEPETEEQVLERFPSIKAVVERDKAQRAARRSTLVAAMQATKQDAYTEPELQAMPLDQLEKVAKLAAVKAAAADVDNTGRGLPRPQDDSNAPPPPIDLAERIRAARGKKSA